jgi:hypothetical protein
MMGSHAPEPVEGDLPPSLSSRKTIHVLVTGFGVKILIPLPRPSFSPSLLQTVFSFHLS